MRRACAEQNNPRSMVSCLPNSPGNYAMRSRSTMRTKRLVRSICVPVRNGSCLRQALPNSHQRVVTRCVTRSECHQPATLTDRSARKGRRHGEYSNRRDGEAFVARESVASCHGVLERLYLLLPVDTARAACRRVRSRGRLTLHAPPRRARARPRRQERCATRRRRRTRSFAR